MIDRGFNRLKQKYCKIEGSDQVRKLVLPSDQWFGISRHGTPFQYLTHFAVELAKLKTSSEGTLIRIQANACGVDEILESTG